MYTERMLHTVERTHTPHTNKDPVHSILFCFANVSSTIGAKMTTKKIYIYRMREQTQQFRTLIHSFNRLLGCCCCSIQTPKRSPRTHSKRHWKHSKSDDASSFHFFSRRQHAKPFSENNFVPVIRSIWLLPPLYTTTATMSIEHNKKNAHKHSSSHME